MVNKLCLLWQNVKTRQWYHVGDLILNDDSSYEFRYDNTHKRRGLDDALKNGYRVFPVFPDTKEKYNSAKMFSVFSRRLPDRRRADYQELFQELGITDDSSDFDLLSATGGSLNSDAYEFVKPIEFSSNKFFLDFYLRGWRHYNGEDEILTFKDQISLELDCGNKYDNCAVAILKNDEKRIGYVPAFFSEFIKAVIEKGLNYEIEILFNADAPSHYKVEISMNGIVDEQLIKDFSEKILVIS